VEVSSRYFSFLEDSQGAVEITVGDGRLALEQAAYQAFDVLVLDAFSSDAIPTHLLTREAMETYWRHLKSEGILAINVTNRHINMLPVIQGHVVNTQIPAVFVRHRAKTPVGAYLSHWVLMTRNQDFLAWPPIALNTSKPPVGDHGPLFWTDDHAPVFSLLFN
jgi:spermidine synthase